jgi:hypothetical protein
MMGAGVLQVTIQLWVPRNRTQKYKECATWHVKYGLVSLVWQSNFSS